MWHDASVSTHILFYVDSYAKKRNDTVVDSSTQAVILSAGFATRLYPLTPRSGKSLLPLGDRFVIDFQIDALTQAPSVGTIFVVTNQTFYPALHRWHATSPHKKRITLLSNGVTLLEERKGPIGDLQHVLQRTGIDQDIVVLGNDNLFEDSLESVIQFAKKQNAMTVSVNEFTKTNCITQSNEVVLYPNTFRVQEFHDNVRQALSPYYASCLYVIPQCQLGTIADYLKSQNHHPEPAKHFISWALENKYPFYGYPMQGRRFDTGDHASYNNTCKWFDKI